MRISELIVAIVFAAIFLQPPRILGQTGQDSDSLIHASKSNARLELFKSFAEYHNKGDIKNQLTLLSPKTKATLAVSHMIRNGMAAQSHKERFSAHTEKWNSKIEKFIESSKIDPDANTYIPLTIAFSKWEFLDRYLVDLYQHSLSVNRPEYSTELSSLKMKHGKMFASARFKIYTNGGFVAGLNGNPLEPISAGTQPVYFVQIDKKWYICNEHEFNGKILPRNK